MGIEISFNNKKLQTACSCEKEMKRRWENATVKKLKLRLSELDAAETLAELGTLPGPRGHELSGGRKGQLAVMLNGGLRLVFEPANEPVPLKKDGGLDWTQVTAVRILEIIDYHG